MWGRFFDSFAANDDNDSVVSGSHQHGTGTDISHPAPFQTPVRNRDLPVAQSPFSEVHPNDSASVVHEDESLGPAFHLGHGSNLGKGLAPPVDDGTYVFKFRSPSGRTHRFQARHDDVEILRDIVAGKLASDPFFVEDQEKEAEGFPALVKPDPTDFALAYVDSDGDTVVITHDNDVTDAVKVARKSGSDRVVLLVQGGRGWEKAEKEGETKAKESAAAAAKEVAQVDAAPVETDLASPVKGQPTTLPTVEQQLPFGGITEKDVFGIPRDLVLPASLGFLGVIIVGVFVASRVANSSRY